jgi:hypothetical protein
MINFKECIIFYIELKLLKTDGLTRQTANTDREFGRWKERQTVTKTVRKTVRMTF